MSSFLQGSKGTGEPDVGNNKEIGSVFNKDSKGKVHVEHNIFLGKNNEDVYLCSMFAFGPIIISKLTLLSVNHNSSLLLPKV